MSIDGGDDDLTFSDLMYRTKLDATIVVETVVLGMSKGWIVNLVLDSVGVGSEAVR